MAELNPTIAHPDQKLIFATGRRRFGSLGLITAAAIFAVVVLRQSTPAEFGVVACLLVFLWCISLPSAVSRWTVEFDLATRRLKIVRRSLGRWTTTIVDCSFDECIALGTFEYNTEGHLAYDVYVRSASGTRHAIPIPHSTLNEAARIASELSASTGIPRLDIYPGPIYIRRDDDRPRGGNSS